MPPLFDYSSSGEPLLFRHFLSVSAPKVLIDVFAGDGVTWSLSHGFLTEGWSALLIEDGPTTFQELKKNCESLPQVHCVKAYCSQHDANTTRHSRSLTSLLRERKMPTELGLLIINRGESVVEALRGLDPVRFRPQLIVGRDIQGDVDRRRSSYQLLSQYGYRYAGIAAGYSIWSMALTEPRAAINYFPTEAPELPQLLTGHAAFDATPSALHSSGAAQERSCLISGWAFVEPAYIVPPLVYLEVRDQRTGASEYFQAYRCRRPDVSAHFSQANLLMSGFRALIPLGHRAAESVSIRVIQADAEYCYHSKTEKLFNRVLEDYEEPVRRGLAQKFLSGSGIEIGALQKPLPVPESCSVRYVDRMPLSELLHHYPELTGLPLQAPDFVDDGETLSTIASQSQNFVIANHFFEHSEDPIRTLTTFLRVLRRGGILFMAVPDKRYTFDFDRPSTNYDVLKQTYNIGRRPDRENLFEEWVRCVEHRDDDGKQVRIRELLAAHYSIHYNVWTVDELVTQLLQARTDFALPFRVVSLVCTDNEAIIILEATADEGMLLPDQCQLVKPNRSEHRSAADSEHYIDNGKLSTNISNDAMTQSVTAISKISASDSTSTNPRYAVWKHVIPLPPDSLMWSIGGATIENFLVVGDAWAQVISRYTLENTTLLDIGSGCGRTARVLVNNRWITRYVGFDVISENVEWCRRYIAPHWHGTAEFHWFDVYSREYNPNGPLNAQDLRFPCADGEADLVFAASVFTHLLEPDAIHYLSEVGRVLSLRGTALLSIHNNVPAGERFCGTEARIDMDPAYFVELAAAAGLREDQRIDDLAGQQLFIFRRSG